VKVTLITKKLGEITLPLSVNIVGNTHNNPHIINIMANSIGPIVEVGVKQLDFGNVNVLQDYVQKIKVTNKSKIEADFHAFTKKKPKV
jgi:hydrocephalus-inducing protein